MQSNNPVFRRSEEFNGTATANQGYSDPATWGTGAPTTTLPGERMTIDSVVQKTGFSLAIVVATALATWVMTGDLLTDDAAAGRLVLALTVGSLGAFAMSMVNSFKREISPILVMIFAAFEGVALGALSKFFDAQYGDNVVSGAVLGTFAAFAGTLAAYKYFNISVSPKFRKFVVAAMFGMVGLALMEFVLGLFGASIGLFDVSGLGMFTAFGGLLLGVFMLIMDFDFVENGVAAGLPEKESWRAAFAITVSLVWIYTNLLRILAFFSQD
jgi:uncharacterized YccA/Bax inhibitor family protein